jgi:hypothetical protein
MLWRGLADTLVVVHVGFVVFVVFGGFLVWRWPRLVWAHVPAFVWGAGIELTGKICPLTPLENVLRRSGGEAGYSGGFVEHYVVPVLYPDRLTAQLQIWLGVGVLIINGFAYIQWLAVRRRMHSAQRGTQMRSGGEGSPE